MIDWRLLFAKYMDVVGWHEGVHFLYEGEWTPEEWAAIRELFDEVQIPKGNWAPFET